MVYLIAIRDADPMESLQKFPGMAGIACLLIFIQDNPAALVHLACAVYPHVTFGPGASPVFIYEDRSLVRLQDMIGIQFLVQVIIEYCQITFRTPDRPVGHVLAGNMQPISLEFLFLTVKRNGIDIFGIYDRRFQ